MGYISTRPTGYLSLGFDIDSALIVNYDTDSTGTGTDININIEVRFDFGSNVGFSSHYLHLLELDHRLPSLGPYSRYSKHGFGLWSPIQRVSRRCMRWVALTDVNVR